MNIPDLSFVNREREYKSHPEKLRDKVVYEYIFKGMTHRWLDENILGLDANYSRGYQSMGILHYLGLKNNFKGIFKDLSESDAIRLLKCKDEKSYKNLIDCILRHENNLYTEYDISMFTPQENSNVLIKQIGTSQYTDGVRIDKNFHEIFNSPNSPFYVERGKARKIKVLFNNKIFYAEYRYENQTNKEIVLQSIRFRKELKEEFKKVFPKPIGEFSIQIGRDINHFVFNHKADVNELDYDDEAEEYPEGKRAYRTHRVIERNKKVIKAAKDKFKKRNNGRLFCEICNFDFTKVYGDRGKDFIEGHHKKLVSEMKEGEKTKVEDISLLCSNCHRMVHRKPMLTIEEFSQLIRTINRVES